jgi:hypothetical protein
MRIHTSVVRRFLSVALACGLLAALAPAARAQSGDAEPKPKVQGCGFLNVTISGTKAKVSNVTCDSGSFVRTEPDSGAISDGQPVLVVLSQSGGAGPGCTITLTGQSSTAVVRAEQNLCALKAGQVKAFVISGNAKLVRASRGSFPSQPGTIFFSLGF